MTEPHPEAVPRELEAAAVSALLTRAATAPAGLVITGEAGIGKSTLWLSARQDAAAQGFRVLSARGAPGEVRLAFAALADLLADVDQAVIELLPPVQRTALNRILLRGNDGPLTDERAVAAAFRGVVQHLASSAPVLIAIDDVQWLDSSSAAAVRFAARRLSGAVALLVTARSGEPNTADVLSQLQLPHPDAVHRLQMSPLTLGGLHALVAQRLGRVLPRPTMTRIHEVSGGNPLYALELARAVADGHRIDEQLPDSLAAFVRARVQHVDAETKELLLAAACTPEPTVELLAMATATPAHRVVEALESGDAARIVVIAGNRIRFTHPLMATGVYGGASPAGRREAHRRLADCVDAPELKARHLASAAVIGDTATLEALDTAAEATRAQGAPAAAAELVDLAIALGGATPERRIRAAEHHFRAGSLSAARRLLQPTIDRLPPGATRCLALMLLGAVLGYADDTPAAVAAFTQAAKEVEDDSELRLHCLLRVVTATVMTGRVDQAVEHAKTATALADRLDVADLRSRALSVWVTVSFAHGLGVDHTALRTALELEDPQGDATTWYLASAVQAMISAWTGDLHEARSQLRAVHRRMLDGGTEIDIIWAANHLATIDVWLGRYADAAHASRDAVERAEQMGGRHVLITAWGWQAAVAAYTGREAEARTAAGAAVAAAHEIGAPYLADAPSATLAFLEVSLGNYGAAMTVLDPLLATFDPDHQTELVRGGHLPDAIEALTGLDRIDEAETLVKALHDNGTRLDRAWMLAMAARGRALCLVARGDLLGAEEAAIEAVAHHDGLPMPFETARTQLLLGQLQRRRRHRTAAAATLRAALDTFEGIGAPVWAERARAELARLGAGADRPRSGLTPAEQRIAERAAAGLSNKEIAGEQFLALKTVEMTLSNVYRKLGIRSRAQLHPRLNGEDSRDIPGSPPVAKP